MQAVPAITLLFSSRHQRLCPAWRDLFVATLLTRTMVPLRVST
jgi:hypothetical protein